MFRHKHLAMENRAGIRCHLDFSHRIEVISWNMLIVAHSAWSPKPTSNAKAVSRSHDLQNKRGYHRLIIDRGLGPCRDRLDVRKRGSKNSIMNADRCPLKRGKRKRGSFVVGAALEIHEQPKSPYHNVALTTILSHGNFDL